MWSPEQQQAFEQIKQGIVHAVALGPLRTGHDLKNRAELSFLESMVKSTSRLKDGPRAS